MKLLSLGNKFPFNTYRIWQKTKLKTLEKQCYTPQNVKATLFFHGTEELLQERHWFNKSLLLHLSLHITWLRAVPLITMEGLTASGGTGSTVTINQSGRACLGLIPRISHSSSVILLNISWTRSAVSGIFFSCESSFTSFHSAVSSRPLLLICGWFRPQPPWLLKKLISQNKNMTTLDRICSSKNLTNWRNWS